MKCNGHYKVEILWFCPHVWFFMTPWTVDFQAPLSMGFPRQAYWSGLPFPFSGDLPYPGIEPTYFESPALAGRFFTTAPPVRTTYYIHSLPHCKILTWHWLILIFVNVNSIFSIDENSMRARICQFWFCFSNFHHLSHILSHNKMDPISTRYFLIFTQAHQTQNVPTQLLNLSLKPSWDCFHLNNDHLSLLTPSHPRNHPPLPASFPLLIHNH